MKNNVGDYVVQGIKNAILVGSIGFLGAFAGAIALDLLPANLFEPIEDRTHLEIMLKEEMGKLGITDKKVVVVLKNTGMPVARVRKIDEDFYMIVLDGDGKNRYSLKNELYHISDGHFESLETCSNSIEADLKYLFIYEPQAVLYELLGIQL